MKESRKWAEEERRWWRRRRVKQPRTIGILQENTAGQEMNGPTVPTTCTIASHTQDARFYAESFVSIPITPVHDDAEQRGTHDTSPAPAVPEVRVDGDQPHGHETHVADSSHPSSVHPQQRHHPHSAPSAQHHGAGPHSGDASAASGSHHNAHDAHHPMEVRRAGCGFHRSWGVTGAAQTVTAASTGVSCLEI
jgi:hypothetical protein